MFSSTTNGAGPIFLLEFLRSVSVVISLEFDDRRARHFGPVAITDRVAIVINKGIRKPKFNNCKFRYHPNFQFFSIFFLLKVMAFF